jgi:aspartate/methionine/tyrosine aminotransferase
MRDFEPNKMKQIPFTGIRRVLEKATKLENEGRKIVHFEVGLPDFDTPPHICKAAKDALDQGMTRYTSNYGLPKLRQAIAAKLKRDNGLEVDPMSELIVTSGGQEAVAAAILALLDAGDEVLLADPGYAPYTSLVRAANALPLFIPLKENENFTFDLDYMEKAVGPKTKMLILCNPSNPTGTLMDKDTLLKLAEFAEKHDLLVISDEAYEKIIYDNISFTSFATLPEMRKRTITIHTISKSYAMCGWRVGYIAAPVEISKVIIRIHMNLVLSTSAFAQCGAIAALEGSQDDLKHMVEKFDERRRFMTNEFEKLAIPLNRPQAAFYLFPNITQFGMDSFSFAEYVLDKHGVAFVPGVEFGARGEGFVRISYATSLENCRLGIERFSQAVKELREKGK